MRSTDRRGSSSRGERSVNPNSQGQRAFISLFMDFPDLYFRFLKSPNTQDAAMVSCALGSSLHLNARVPLAKYIRHVVGEISRKAP